MRLFLAMIFFLSVFFGKEIEAEYKVSFGLFGSVGKGIAHFDANTSRYHIKIYGKATGLAKVLSGGREEIYESFGKIENGILVPEKFVKITKTNKKKRIKTFRFDHEKKEILITKEGFRRGKFEFETHDKLPYYVRNDLLTLYFNLPTYLQENKKKYVLHAVGGDRKDGRVDIFLPEGKKLQKLKEILKVDGLYLGVVVHQKIFASENGELFVVIDKDGVAKKGLLKDVIMYGDIVGTLTKKSVRD